MSTEIPTKTAPPQSGSQRPSALADLPFRLEVFLEPKGFIRAIEFVLAICMFATTAGYNSMFSFYLACLDSKGEANWNTSVEYHFSYPFSFSQKIHGTCLEAASIEESPSGAAKFFVVVGVFAMLYTIASLVWYVVLEARYLKYEVVPIVDFVVTGVFTLLFFIASCAWAAGVSTVKYWTNFENLNDEGNILYSQCSEAAVECTSGNKASYGSLNISILFGFLNVLVWGGNVWFMWKETPWFRARDEAKTGANLDNNV